MSCIDSPGEHLAEELEARNWSQTDFAHVLGRPIQFVSEIMTGKKEITRESAAQIAAAFGTSAQYWLNLQNDYLLRKHEEDPRARRGLDEVRLRARMNELAPVALMLKRGLLHSRDLDGLRRELEALFETDDLFDEPTLSVAARRTDAVGQLTRLQTAWLACARRAAARVPATAFDLDGLKNLGRRLSQIATSAAAFEQLPPYFSEVGVRLVHVAAFPGSKMDGAAFLLQNDQAMPAIALSGRGKRLDKVLFTLLHEVAHIVAGHVVAGRSILDDEARTTAEERQANEMAGSWILPDQLDPAPAVIRHDWVVTQAAKHHVHPLAVIGRLQHDGVIDWRSALVRDGESVTDALSAWAG